MGRRVSKCQNGYKLFFHFKTGFPRNIHLSNSLLPEREGFECWLLIIHAVILAGCHVDVNLLFFLIKLTFIWKKRANIYMCED